MNRSASQRKRKHHGISDSSDSSDVESGQCILSEDEESFDNTTSKALPVSSGILGTQDSASLDAKNPVRTLIIPFRGFPRTRNFSGWTSVISPKMSILEVVK